MANFIVSFFRSLDSHLELVFLSSSCILRSELILFSCLLRTFVVFCRLIELGYRNEAESERLINSNMSR